MTLIEQLLSETELGRKELRRQRLIVEVTEKIWAAMEERNISKAELAQLLDTSKSNVTQLLGGQRNMTLSSLADICAALDVEPEVTIKRVGAAAVPQTAAISHVWRTGNQTPTATVSIRRADNAARPTQQGLFKLALVA